MNSFIRNESTQSHVLGTRLKKTENAVQMTAPRRKYFVFSYYWRERGNFSKIKNRKESRAVGNLRASGDDHQLFLMWP